MKVQLFRLATFRIKIYQIPQALHHSSVSWEISLLYFFIWNFIWFKQKEPVKVQNFRLLTAYVKFHQICVLIGSFCCKYIKFHLRKCRGFMSHDTEEWYKIWKNTDLWFRKWRERFGKFLAEHSTVFKSGTLMRSSYPKYIIMSLKFTEELRVMTRKNDAKFEKKLTCRFKIGTRNLRNFDLSTQKVLNICTLMDFFWTKHIMFEIKKVQTNRVSWY